MFGNKKAIIQKIPNILSTTRLGLGIIMPIVFIFLGALGKTMYYALGNLTDALDGFIAKNFNAKSDYGKVADPIADKFFNLMALISAAIFINPMLVSILTAEAAIATITVKHGIHNVKKRGANKKVWKNVDTKGMDLREKIKAYWNACLDKVEVYVDAVQKLNVSRFGRKKAILMVTTIISVFLTPIFPALSSITSALIGITMIAEVPVVSKYMLGYCKDLGKTNDFENKCLLELNKFDNTCDKFDANVKALGKKIIKSLKGIATKTKGNNILDEKILSNQDAELSKSINDFRQPVLNNESDRLKNAQEINKDIPKKGTTNYQNNPRCYTPHTIYDNPSSEEDLGSARIKRM
jgi:phosphatidylglycerophosphate synthase